MALFEPLESTVSMCFYVLWFAVNTVITQLNVDCLTVDALRCVKRWSELVSQVNANMGLSQWSWIQH